MVRECVRGIGRVVVRGIWGGYSMDTLHTFVKLLKNRLKYYFEKIRNILNYCLSVRTKLITHFSPKQETFR